VLPDSFLVLEQQFEQFFSVDSSDGDALHQLHQLHLQLLRFTAQAKWDQEISEANLKALCGESDGIGELLTWRRKQSTSSKLDETALKSQHPDIYDSFAQEAPNPKFEVVPMRSYL
jgi:predicted phage-related endonuclease